MKTPLGFESALQAAISKMMSAKGPCQILASHHVNIFWHLGHTSNATIQVIYNHLKAVLKLLTICSNVQRNYCRDQLEEGSPTRRPEGRSWTNTLPAYFMYAWGVPLSPVIACFVIEVMSDMRFR